MNASSRSLNFPVLPSRLDTPPAFPSHTARPATVRRRRFPWGWLALGFVAACVAVLVVLVLSFRMGGGARDLRRAVAAAAPGAWERQFELGVGRLPVWLAKASVGPFLDLPPEARAGVRAVQSGAVGIYRRADTSFAPQGSVLAEVREAMDARGWATLVAVQDGDQVVSVFVPDAEDSLRRFTACVLVIDRDQMVIASGQADLEPLVDLASSAIRREAGQLPRLDLDRLAGRL